jgi:outer membrane lipoprotein SlyB
MKLSTLAAAAIAVACLVSGCASVNKASSAASSQAKTFTPVTDKAVVYIYRNEILGGAIKMPVDIDGMLVGETGPKSFLRLGVTPGKHVISSLSEKNADLNIDLQAGQTYYVWQEVKMGMMSARSQLHLMTAAQGQKGVLECDLLETTAPAMRLASP